MFQKIGNYLLDHGPTITPLMYELENIVNTKLSSLITDIFSINNHIPVNPLLKKHQRLDLDANSSIIFNPLTNKYTYITAAPAIKNLVISGGGAKGVILPGVFKAFEDHKIDGNISFRNQIDNVSGSSVGALSASLLAVGMTAQDLIDATRPIEFKNLLGSGLGPVFKDGNPLIEFNQVHTQKSVLENLKKIFSNDDIENISIEMIVEQLKNKAPHQANAIANNIEQILKKICREEPFSLTFEMLENLHILEPKIFKSLTVTATCCENGTTFYFDALKTPHLDISIACRASASLPVILNPVTIKKELLSPGYDDILSDKAHLTFSDGGYFDNIPVKSMQEKQGEKIRGENGQNLQTLALVFDASEPSENAQSPFFEAHQRKHTLYDSTNLMDRLVTDVFARILGGINTTESCSLAKEEGLEEIRENYAQRSIPLRISLSTMDFEKAKIFEDEFIEQGYSQGRDYLALHQDELIARTFDNFDELLENIPNESQAQMTAQLHDFRKRCV
ncbi:MAG: patatin-like phospholipase family protein [Candidatus Protochlamydia sp.]|nr:patatin-like phospholipase family protein [Candidatus Protochlamydia sp.]